MRTSEQPPRNIYKTARRFAGLTQERWAEAIGVSTDSVRCYENGSVVPSDATVAAMCEISNHAALGFWHIRNKSTLAAETLPEVEQLPLPQAVLQLLLAISDFESDHGRLIDLAADGTIEDNEATDWQTIKKHLDAIIKAAIQVKVAEGGA